MKRITKWGWLFPLFMLVFAASSGAVPLPADLTPDARLVTGRLPNGFSYMIRENGHPKNRVALHLVVKSGSREEAEAERGLAHYLEHMAFNGSIHFPPGTLVDYFQEIGMDFGGDTNASTAFDRTSYDIILPDNGNATIDKGLRVLKDFAVGLTFPEAEVERERGVILSELRERDTAVARVSKATRKFWFEGTRYPERAPGGEAGVVSRVGKADFERFYRTWYRPERMVLVVVGDVTASRMVEKIAAFFSDVKGEGEARATPDFGNVAHKGDKVLVYPETGAGAVTVSLAVARNIPAQPDSLARRRELFLRYVTLSMLDNRLRDRVARQDVPFEEGSAFYHEMQNRLAFSGLRAQVDPDGWQETLGILEKELRRAITYGFTQAELDRARGELVAWLASDAERDRQQPSERIARGLVSDVVQGTIPVAPTELARLLKAELESMTVAEADAALRGIWKEDHRLISVTGNVDGEEAALETAALSTLAKSRAYSVSPQEMAALPDFPYLPERPFTRPVDESVDKALGIQDYVFSDGTILHVKNTDFQPDEVRITVGFGGGRTALGEGPELARLAEGLVNRSGTGILRPEELERILTPTQVKLRFQVESSRFVFSGSSRTSELPLLLALIQARLEDPAFRKEARTISDRKQEKSVQSAEREVSARYRKEAARFFTGDKRLGWLPSARYAAIDSAPVERALKKAFGNAPLEISIVGDVAPDLAVAAVARRLVGYRARLWRTRMADWKAPRGIREVVMVDGEKPEAIVSMGFPTSGIHPAMQNRTLNLLADILSERMRIRIREGLGIAYSPYSYHWSRVTQPDYGVLIATVSTEPQHIRTVERELRKIARELRAGRISSAELEQARKPTLTRVRDQVQQNTYWLSAVLDRSAAFPELRFWAKNLEQDYLDIDLEAVKQQAALVFDPEAASTLVVRTRPKR